MAAQSKIEPRLLTGLHALHLEIIQSLAKQTVKKGPKRLDSKKNNVAQLREKHFKIKDVNIKLIGPVHSECILN